MQRTESLYQELSEFSGSSVHFTKWLTTVVVATLVGFLFGVLYVAFAVGIKCLADI